MTTNGQKLDSELSQQPIVSPKDVPPLSVAETEVPVLSPASGQSLEDHHAEFAEFEEGYIRSYIGLADTKAAWTFTIASGALAYLFSQNTTRIVLVELRWSVFSLALLLSGILLFLSAFYSFRVVAPRLKSPSGEGIIFFGSVAAKPNASSYVSAVAARDKRALADARLSHCYDVALVCNSKYASLKKAIWLGVPGLAIAIASLLLTPHNAPAPTNAPKAADSARPARAHHGSSVEGSTSVAAVAKATPNPANR